MAAATTRVRPGGTDETGIASDNGGPTAGPGCYRGGAGAGNAGEGG
jgi:hypothetical protein